MLFAGRVRKWWPSRGVVPRVIPAAPGCTDQSRGMPGDAGALGEQIFLNRRVGRDRIRRTRALMIEITTRRSRQLVLARGEPSLGDTSLVKIVRGRRTAHLCCYPSGF